MGNNAEEKIKERAQQDKLESWSTSWYENKYYQRFLEDQRLAENMGLIKRSALTAFLEDYYKDNPLDNSYEGILARKSGLTKDQVQTTLAYIDQLNFLASYNPTNYYPVLLEEQEETLAYLTISNLTDDSKLLVQLNTILSASPHNPYNNYNSYNTYFRQAITA